MSQMHLETDDAIRKLEELGVSLDPEVAFDAESMFPKLSGWGASREIRRKHKLVSAVTDFLRRALRPGEEVLYVAQGVQFNLSEQYFLGIWANLINQRVIVLTNMRMLLIHSDSKGRPRHQAWMIFYNQITRLRPSWFGQFDLHLRDGQKLRFSSMRGLDKKYMPEVFQRALETYEEFGFDPASSQSRENLCTACFQAVPKGEYECQCGEQFWRPSEIALRSLIIPAWGEFTLRHYPIACAELLGYVLSWLVILGMITNAEPGPHMATTLMITLIILGLEHGVSTFLTYSLAKKGLTSRPGRRSTHAVPAVADGVVARSL